MLQEASTSHNACSSFGACLSPALIAAGGLLRLATWTRLGCAKLTFLTALPGRAVTLPQMMILLLGLHTSMSGYDGECAAWVWGVTVLTHPAGTDGPHGNTGLLSPLTRIVATPCYRAPEVSSQHGVLCKLLQELLCP